MHVNVSARELAQPDLPHVVTEALRRTGTAPEELCLEVSERALGRLGPAVELLERLRGLGVGLAIDDYGSGPTSLASLRDLPVGVVKLDPFLVEPLARDGRTGEVVAAVIGLAHALGLVVVAEGVETGAQLARLDELADEDWVREDTLERTRGLFDYRRRRFAARFDGAEDGEAYEERSAAYTRLLRELLSAERDELLALRNEGHISDEVRRRVERDLDLEESRLGG
jgi:hypothetical protein